MAQSVQTVPGAYKKTFIKPAYREAITGYLFAMPWIIGFLLFTVGPMAFSLFTSFTKYNITTDPVWIGTDNYTEILKDDRFYQSLGNTFWIVAVKVPVVTALSIVIALLLNMEMPFAKTFRTVLYLPNVLSGVAAIFLWRWILAPDGLFNKGLGLFGINGPGWFVDPIWTKPAIVVMGLWWIGGNILIYLAGLKGISQTLYEAARIDGANSWQQVRNITLPMLSPTIFFQVVTGVIGAFQIFTTAYIIATFSGAPVSLGGPGGSLLFYVLYLYNRAFGFTGKGGYQMGYASALAWILFFIILAITLLQLWLAKRWVYYENER